MDDVTIANLAIDLPLYLAAADSVMCDSEEGKLVWWAAHRDTHPHWVALVRKLLLVQPSSAASERVLVSSVLCQHNKRELSRTT